MKIQKIKTQNFKTLGTQTFDFTDGLNFVVGDNGAGKSTLLRAIATVSYGVTALPGLSEDVATWGEKSWRIEMEFSHKGKQYQIYRTKSSAKISCGDEIMASGNTPVSEFMQELLGVDLKDYNLFIHSRQGETSYALTYGATALQRKVEEYSGIKLVEDIQQRSRGIHQSYSDSAEDLEAQMEGVDIDTLTKEMEEKSQRIHSLQEELKGVQKELDDLIKPEEPDIGMNQLKDLRKMHKAYQTYLSDVKSVQMQRQSLESQLLNYPEEKDDDQALDLEDKVNQIKKDKKLRQKIEGQRRIINRDMQDLVKPAEVDEGPTQEELEALQKDVNEYSSLIADLKSESKHLEKHIKTGVCEMCGTVLEDEKKLDQAKTRLEEVGKELENASETKKDLDKKLTELEDAARSYSAYESALDKYESQMAELKSDLDGLPDDDPWTEQDEEVLENAQKELAEHSIRQENVRKNNLKRKRILNELSQLEDPKKVPEVSDEELEQAEDEFFEFQSNMQIFQDDKRSLDARRNEVSAAISKAESDKDRISSSVEEYKGKDKERKALLSSMENLKQLDKYLGKRRATYLQEVWEGIMTYATNFVRETTDNWITDVKISDGRISYEQNGVWIPVAEASGAQAAFIGAAVRIGLNKVLYGSESFLVFDEPTESMTEENSRGLMSGLLGQSEQVIVVTHRGSDQGLASNVIEL